MMADSDLREDGEEVYTVIPTAPEDMMFDSSFDTSSPILHNNNKKSQHHPPALAFTGRPNNGSSHHATPGRNNAKSSSREGSKRKDGLPSHAFSRNYYCRFCAFNTTKSKVHLYHLVDVHGVDYKIFSCDRCDYASRWKCKVIRHRKMIHKINEPKFEPEMHDSRSQTGKRPPPVHNIQQSSPIPTSGDSRTAYLNATQSQSLSANQPLPSFVQPFTQSPHLAAHPINPFINKSAALQRAKAAVTESARLMMKEEEDKPAYLSAGNLHRAAVTDSTVSRRKQRKPQNVRKVVQDGAENIYEAIKSEIDNQDGDMDQDETTSETRLNQVEEPPPLLGLFGGLDDSGSSGAGGILSGPSWRRRLMPTAVTMTTGSPTVAEKNATSPTPEDQRLSKISLNNNTIGTSLKPSLSQMSVASSHSNSSIVDTSQYGDDNSIDEQALIKEKCVVEITIDDEPHYRCAECNFISRFRWKTSKHFKANHSSRKEFKCQSCDYTTLNRVDFFTHKASHSSRLDFHMRQQRVGHFAPPMLLPPQGIHKCDECSYTAASKTNLDRHVEKHRQNNPFKCMYCSFTSTGEAAIQRHMAEQHEQSELPLTMRRPASDVDDSQDEGMVNGDGEFNCELCGYTARNWSKMKEHMIRHSEGTPFACSYCDSKYKRPADLNRHLKIKHNTCLADIGLDGPTLKGVMGPSFPGSALEEQSPGEGTLPALKRLYQSSEHGGDSDADEPKRLCIDEEGVNLQCGKCSYIAKWKSDLERHMKKVHSEEKRFGCPTCFKSYKYQGDLNVHMRKSHAAGHIRSPKQQGSGAMNMPSSMCKTPPPNVQVLSNEVIVNMSHAAIVNPLANLGPALFPMANQKQGSSEQPQYQVTRPGPQMPMLKPAPNARPTGSKEKASAGGKEAIIKLNSDGKPIKKGELDPSTMIHVPGGEFKCLNCCYETNFKSHLDAHMRLHPEKPFRCKFCNYASYWRGDTKKHIEKNHPEKLPDGINPYNLVEQVFEEAVRNSPHRHKPLPEVHNLPSKTDTKSDKGMIWTPPNEDSTASNGSPASIEPLKIPTLHHTPSSSVSPSIPHKTSAKNKGEDGPTHVQCPHCNYNTTSESRLNAHMATHYNLKIFKCPDCGKRANWKWDIQKHMRTDHPGCVDEVIVMDTDEAKETLDEYLKQHPEQRGKPKIGVAADYRPEHWPKPRQDMTSSSKTTSIRPFRCSICSRRSNWKCDIRKHYRQVHPGRVEARVELMTREELIEAGEKEDDVDQHYPEMKNSKGMNSVRPYKCSLCGKNSRWKWDVAKHIKMVHKGIADAHVIEDEEAIDNMDSDPGTPDTSMTDGDGENSLSHSPAGLKIKERSSPDPTPRPAKHNGPKIGCYECSICSQYSEFMWVIRRHIRSLHPDNLDAKIVDKSTKGDDSAHSDSRPYICSLCGKRSNWKWDVKKHILSVHRGSIGSILDELLNKETVIYTDGKTMEVDDGNTKQKIADIKSHLKEEGAVPQAAAHTSTSSNSASVNKNCYSSLPTMVSLPSAVAPSPDPSSQGELSNGAESSKSSPSKDSDGLVKFKCGYCFFASASKNETISHVRAEHDGKILRIQTLNKPSRDEQTTYKAAHRTSTTTNDNSIWKCSQCSFEHTNKEDALMHIAQHDLYNAYQCAVCDFADDKDYTLRKHIKTKHGEIENVEAVLLQNILFVPHVEESETTSTGTGVSYTCNQCEMKTAWRSAIVRHIKEKHIIESDIHSMFTKHGSNKPEGSPSDQSRRYNCTICPYKTDKVSMFNEHMERHTCRSESDIKCQYCDYWVTANRLLHQHTKLHQQEQLATANSVSINGEDSAKHDKYMLSGGLAQCPDCPYRGKTKDLNAHRKLHKQRPGAIYKCAECPYWVNHNRLLQQHAKVHSPRYRQKAFTSSLNLGDTSIEDVAAFKQHLISSQVAPIKLELSEGPDRLKRRLHTCHMCPFASNQLANVEEHAFNHGAKAENSLKCKFCDFYCESRELMAQHIKVHSLQYQGELDDDDGALSEPNGNDMSEGEEVDGETIESMAGFNLKYNRKEMTLNKQKKGLASRKYSCEKCAYASALKDNFRRHMRLHGSKQGFTCEFCDYSVPTAKLLKSHEVLHEQPNRNLLATQSIMNLTKLKPVSADIQLAHSGERIDDSVTDVHDHLNMYENADSIDMEQHDGITPMDDEGEPEFIDLAELGSKVTRSADELSTADSSESMESENGGDMLNGGDDDEEFEMEDGEEVWICRFCDRAFDSELDLTSHEKQHA